jgi:hypothetical protein
MPAARIDWNNLANQLGLITLTEGGRSERGGSDPARKALAEILGRDAIVASVDDYIDGAPGSELIRSVLKLLYPAWAIERCLEVFRSNEDLAVRRSAIELLRVAADASVIDCVLEFLDDPDPGIQSWGIGVIDQLLMSRRADIEDCEGVLMYAEAHPNEQVREKAHFIRENFS